MSGPVRVLAALAAAVGSGTVLGSVLGVRQLAAGHAYGETEVPPAPVALVLGALVFPDGTPSPFLLARLDLARRLLAAGRVETLVLSGDAQAPEYDEPTAMRAYLLAAGVPADRIRIDGRGVDTYASCWRLRHVFGVRDAVVVTQRYHLPRAVATARALGIHAIGVGDTTARRYRFAYLQGWARDQLACVKTLANLVAGRQAALG